MKQLVLSYAREDRQKVDDLVRNLQILDYHVWIDSALKGGQQWWDAILEKIEECDALIVAVSPASLTSEACLRERKYADALGKPILPVAVEPTTQAIPRELAARQIIDLTADGKDQAFRLARDLADLPPAPALPEAMPPKPEAPLSYITDLVDRLSAPSLTQPEQREIVDKIETALRSIDSEEQKGARDIVMRMSARGDLFADVDRRLQAVRSSGAGGSATPILQAAVVPEKLEAEPPKQVATEPPKWVVAEPPKRSKLVTALAVIGAIFVALVVIGMLSGGGTCGYDAYGYWVC